MSNHRSWQERGIRLGNEVLDSEEAAQIVRDLRTRVRDPQAIQEVDEFLNGTRAELSPRVKDLLVLIVTGIVMSRPKRR